MDNCNSKFWIIFISVKFCWTCAKKALKFARVFKTNVRDLLRRKICGSLLKMLKKNVLSNIFLRCIWIFYSIDNYNWIDIFNWLKFELTGIVFNCLNQYFTNTISRYLLKLHFLNQIVGTQKVFIFKITKLKILMFGLQKYKNWKINKKMKIYEYCFRNFCYLFYFFFIKKCDRQITELWTTFRNILSKNFSRIRREFFLLLIGQKGHLHFSP